MVGAECEMHQGMHLNPSAVFVEFMPLQGAEEEGLHEILVTDLLNYGMPLIRYRINDCAILAPNPCRVRARVSVDQENSWTYHGQFLFGKWECRTGSCFD